MSAGKVTIISYLSMGTFGHKVRFFRFTDSVCENVIYHIRIANPSIATLNSVYKHWASEAVSFANENKNNQKVKKTWEMVYLPPGK